MVKIKNDRLNFRQPFFILLINLPFVRNLKYSSEIKTLRFRKSFVTGVEYASMVKSNHASLLSSPLPN